MENSVLATEANNYIKSFKFFNSGFNIKKSVDLVCISIKKFYDHTFFVNLLKSNGFKSIRNVLLEDQLHSQIWRFENSTDNVAIEMVYDTNLRYVPPIIIRIHDPNIKTQSLLYSTFKNFRIDYSISYLELAFDFYSDDILSVHEFLTKTVFQRYQYFQTFWVKSTYYTTNIRRSTRGVIVYLKGEKPRFVRMELRLRGPVLKKLNLRHSLCGLDKLDISHFIKFMILNEEGLSKYLISQDRRQKYRRDKNADCMKLELQECTINNWVSSLGFDGCTDHTPLMSKWDALKAMGREANFHRFLISLDDFTAEFKKKLAGQQFWH